MKTQGGFLITRIKQVGGRVFERILSEKNIDAFYDRHLKYMVGVPFTASFAKDAVERHRKDICNHHNYCQVMDDELYAVTELMG